MGSSESKKVEEEKAKPIPKEKIKDMVSKEHLAIGPSQFVVENFNDIRSIYTFDKVLGQGKSNIYLRIVWCGV